MKMRELNPSTISVRPSVRPSVISLNEEIRSSSSSKRQTKDPLVIELYESRSRSTIRVVEDEGERERERGGTRENASSILKDLLLVAAAQLLYSIGCGASPRLASPRGGRSAASLFSMIEFHQILLLRERLVFHILHLHFSLSLVGVG